MTEVEWLAATDPTPMLEFLAGRASDRKLKLLGLACCWNIWPLIDVDRSQEAVAIAEQFLEGWVDKETIRQALDRAATYVTEGPAYYAAASAAQFALHRYPTFTQLQQHVLNPAAAARGEGEHQKQAALVRDIFGNPFRPVSVDPSWLTSTVVALASGIYAERAFDRMPILADALMDAGCDNADVLNHCRRDGPHVRGCWVVDLLTGRT
jgi:hypothetical protein